jgi:[ribosomal protein S5]-alanine N-acetyltransferase
LQTILSTKRLELIPLRRPLLEAFTANRADFSRLLAADVPVEWPVTPELIPFVLSQLDSLPQAAGWLPWAIIDLQTACLIGDAGFKGVPDNQGCCEIGYSVIPSFRQRGFATEAVSGIIAWVRHVPFVRLLRAEALENNSPSQRVLEKNGFVFAGDYNHPKDGLMRRYELFIVSEVA